MPDFESNINQVINHTDPQFIDIGKDKLNFNINSVDDNNIDDIDNPLDHANIFELEQAECNNDIQDLLGQINSINSDADKLNSLNNNFNNNRYDNINININNNNTNNAISNSNIPNNNVMYNLDGNNAMNMNMNINMDSSGGGLQSLLSEINQDIGSGDMINFDDIYNVVDVQ